MAASKRNKSNIHKTENAHYHPSQFAGTFNLSFLEPQAKTLSYENELLTAEEKAAYYAELVERNGEKNFKKMAKVCRKKAEALKKRLAQLGPDESEPLLEKLAGLESLAEEFDNPTPPDVLASQTGPGSALSSFQEPVLSDMGLTGVGSITESDSATTMSETNAADSEQMRELKRQARFWQTIHTWNAGEQIAYYFCGPNKPPEWEEAMFVRAQKDPNAIKILLSEIRYPMLRLLELTEMASEDAVREVVRELEKYVRLLNLYANLKPDVFKRVACQLQSWPVVRSSHPRLNQIPEQITKKITLGDGTGFEFGAQAKWDPNDLGCKIALQLYWHVKKMRAYPKSNLYSPCSDKAVVLPDVTEGGAVKAWWTVAKEVLLTAYPKPEKDEILRRLTNIKDQFKVRNKILECIKNRFFSLFPKSAR